MLSYLVLTSSQQDQRLKRSAAAARLRTQRARKAAKLAESAGVDKNAVEEDVDPVTDTDDSPATVGNSDGDTGITQKGHEFIGKPDLSPRTHPHVNIVLKSSFPLSSSLS